MKKTMAATAAAITLTVLAGLTPAAAQGADGSSPELVLDNSGQNWDLSLVNPDGSTREIISNDVRGDAGTIVNSNASQANYIKYLGLGEDDGLATAVLVEGDTVDVAWRTELENSHVTVTVNGESVPVASDADSTSFQAELGAPISLALIAVAEAPSPDRGLITSEFTQLTVNTPVAISPISNTMAALAVALPAKSLFRQNTFIPDLRLQLPPLTPCTPFGNSLFAFVGDNRGFSPNDGASFRTRMDVTIQWGTTPIASFVKLVGETVLQKEIAVAAWLDVDRKTASSASMQISVLSSASSYVRFKLVQDVVNPFCDSFSTNGIASTTTVSVYRSGAVSGVISYLAMPNYEVYLSQDGGAFVPLAQLNNMGFGCLIKGQQSAVCNQTVTL